MTVMAAEAGESAVEAEAADSSAAAAETTEAPKKGGGALRTAAKASSGPRKALSKTPQGRIANRAAGGSKKRSGPRRAPGVTRRQEFSKGFPGSGRPSGSYHGVILAEWAVGSLLIIAIPFAKPNQTGVSPYAGKDLVQLGTYTVVFWLLAIFAATGRGQARFAAWFGGLILLAVGLAEASSIATAVKDWLGGSSTTASTATSAAGTTTQTTGNASVVNAPSTETATGISRAVAQAPGNGLT